MASIFKKLLGKLKKEEEPTAAPAENKQEVTTATAPAQSDAGKVVEKGTTVKAEEQPPKKQTTAPAAKAEPKKADSQTDTPTATQKAEPKKAAPAKSAAPADKPTAKATIATEKAASKPAKTPTASPKPATTSSKSESKPAKSASAPKTQAAKAEQPTKVEEKAVKSEKEAPVSEEKTVKGEKATSQNEEKVPQTVPKQKEKTPATTEPIAPAKTVEENTAEIIEPNTTSLLGKFFIKQAKDGSYMFNLKASNGEIIATSDMYSSLEKCKKGIASVQLNAPIANLEDHTVDGAIEEVVNPKFELYHDKGGDFRFRLKAKNGSIIAKSQGYTNKTNCQNGIESVRKNAMSDVIVDEDALAAELVAAEETPVVTEPVADIPAEEASTAEDPGTSNTLMGKFLIKQAKDGSYMFNLKASNGEIIATSDMYSSLEKCKKGIASVQVNAPIANLEDHAVDGAIEEAVNPKFELYQDKGGDFRFRLKAKNGSIIAKSQGYTNKANCRNGIESVRKNAMTDIITVEGAETTNS